ncbi:MAG: hypothetical protein GXP25_25370 [Planctomycetes bacterium]|nr:hypothetical protein [Planctomycetota bacterium]
MSDEIGERDLRQILLDRIFRGDIRTVNDASTHGRTQGIPDGRVTQCLKGLRDAGLIDIMCHGTAAPPRGQLVGGDRLMLTSVGREQMESGTPSPPIGEEELVTLNLSFMTKADVAIDALREAENCRRAGACWATAVFLGTALEAILLDILLRNTATDKRLQKKKTPTLGVLLDILEKVEFFDNAPGLGGAVDRMNDNRCLVHADKYEQWHDVDRWVVLEQIGLLGQLVNFLNNSDGATAIAKYAP